MGTRGNQHIIAIAPLDIERHRLRRYVRECAGRGHLKLLFASNPLGPRKARGGKSLETGMRRTWEQPVGSHRMPDALDSGQGQV
jgi:hypothetical protein